MSREYQRQAKRRKDELIAQAPPAFETGERQPRQIRTIKVDPALHERRIGNTNQCRN